MVAEMNELLADPAWWSSTRRQEAELKFSKVIVEAFYDEIQAGRADPALLREQQIRMPNAAEDNYTRVLMVGTTGAGKTTLVRQLIGSDPETDRFPSTAPAKTTISDIEAILAEGEFEAAVTFFTEFQVQANIEECVSDACIAALDESPSEVIADRLLNHRDQRFRLSYVLGSWRDGGAREAEEDLSFDESAPAEVPDEEPLAETERAENKRVLEGYIERITALTASAQQAMLEALGVDPKTARGAELEAARQLVEENFDLYLQKQDGFHELAQDILDNVRSRFDLVAAGELQRRRSGWPELWTYKTADRTEFIRQIRWFSSNYWLQFGRLLTPLVDGIRFKGPLFPKFTDAHPKLVLIDGQGLGHTPDSSASVTTHITRRFGSVDVILLVDNATQPMQAASLAVLRAVAASGHHEKLAIAFTRFDQITGKSLPTLADKSAHVMASVRSALVGIRDSLGAPVVRAIEYGIAGRCFMLGGVDRQLTRLPVRAAEYMRQQLQSLVQFFEQAILPPPPPEARPIYDPTGLAFAVQEAVNRFQGPWLARLGLGAYEGIGTAHWATVKALNRRIAGGLDVEYSNLQPVADLIARLSESISRFLDRPIGWNREPIDPQEEQSAIAEVRRAVSTAIHELAMRRVIHDQLGDWRTAYDGPEYSGKGSTFRRARAIQGIYDAAAPLPDAVMTNASMAFLGEVRAIVTLAVESAGGTLRLGEAT
jgi:hypothetical protein